MDEIWKLLDEIEAQSNELDKSTPTKPTKQKKPKKGRKVGQAAVNWLFGGSD